MDMILYRYTFHNVSTFIDPTGLVELLDHFLNSDEERVGDSEDSE
jgi:hypothetical protein